ncbi:MAG: hypothetical protein DSZ14_06940 [Candidatus Thioglobus sp.]|nr:MAG: hypothetical protein DSZ14_06940 [Candidatus Thioglobus sp.]
MPKHTKTILIMAGGTGGHIFPALAIAKDLSRRSVTIEWLGSKHGMENTLVPKHNIPLHTVSAVGLRGKNIISLIKAPFLLSLAFIQTIHLLHLCSGANYYTARNNFAYTILYNV